MEQTLAIPIEEAESYPLVLRAGHVLEPSTEARRCELRDDLLYYANTLSKTHGVWALAQKAFAQKGRGVLFALIDVESEEEVPTLRYYVVADIVRALSACPPQFVRRIVEYDPRGECLLLVATVVTPSVIARPLTEEQCAVVACGVYSAVLKDE